MHELFLSVGSCQRYRFPELIHFLHCQGFDDLYAPDLFGVVLHQCEQFRDIRRDQFCRIVIRLEKFILAREEKTALPGFGVYQQFFQSRKIRHDPFRMNDPPVGFRQIVHGGS